MTGRAISLGEQYNRTSYRTGRAIGQDEHKGTLKQDFEIKDKGKLVHQLIEGIEHYLIN